jgi:hypothetical protein
MLLLFLSLMFDIRDAKNVVHDLFIMVAFPNFLNILNINLREKKLVSHKLCDPRSLIQLRWPTLNDRIYKNNSHSKKRNKVLLVKLPISEDTSSYVSRETFQPVHRLHRISRSALWESYTKCYRRNHPTLPANPELQQDASVTVTILSHITQAIAHNNVAQVSRKCGVFCNWLLTSQDLWRRQASNMQKWRNLNCCQFQTPSTFAHDHISRHGCSTKLPEIWKGSMNFYRELQYEISS